MNHFGCLLLERGGGVAGRKPESQFEEAFPCLPAEFAPHHFKAIFS